MRRRMGGIMFQTPLDPSVQVIVTLTVAIITALVLVAPFAAIAYVVTSLYKNRRRK
jgi:hypothetical protein